MDIAGFALSGLGIGALIYGIVDGAEAGWTSSGALLGMTVAVLALVAFVVCELRTDTPMLDVRLFALRGFSAGALALTVQFLCLFGFFLVGLQFIQLILGYSAITSALCLLPMAVIVMPMSRFAPHLVLRFGSRLVMTVGLVCLAVALGIMSGLDAGSTYVQFLAGLAVFGLGMALTSTPATTAIVTSLPRAKQGVASAVNDVSRELGSALGIAILGSLFNQGYRAAVADATAGLPAESAHAVEESAGAGLGVAARAGDAGAPLAQAVTDAFTSGLGDAMRAGAVIALATAALTFWRAPGRSTEGGDAEAGAAEAESGPESEPAGSPALAGRA